MAQASWRLVRASAERLGLGCWVDRPRSSTNAIIAAVDGPLIVAGVLFLVWPFQYQRSMRKIRARIRTRTGDVARFDRAMERRWIRGKLVVVPVAGVILIVLGAAR